LDCAQAVDNKHDGTLLNTGKKIQRRSLPVFMSSRGYASWRMARGQRRKDWLTDIHGMTDVVCQPCLRAS